MLYDYYYDIVATGISIILIIAYMLRQTYPSKSLRIFFTLIWCNLIASVFDTISCFTISFPKDYPLWFNYAVSLGYMLFYNLLSVLFLLYIASKAQMTHAPIKIFSACVSIFYLLVIISSPWTHFVAYFDTNLIYRHGPVFPVLFALPFVSFIFEIVIFVYARERFSLYQLYASVSLIFGMGFSVAVSIIFPRILIGQLAMAIIMFFIYVTFENPAHFNFYDTQCMNRSAFTNYLHEYKKTGRQIGIIGFSIHDYEYIRHNRGDAFADQISVKIADYLYRNYKLSAFAISNEKFVIIYDFEKNVNPIIDTLKEYFEKPLKINDEEIRVEIDLIKIDQAHFSKYSVEDFESALSYCIENKLDGNDENIENIIQNMRHNDQILHAISKAIKNDSFHICFQPIYSIEHERFVSAEALIRLYDEELGLINSEEMITLAEQNGLIDQVGEIVFRKVCALMHEHPLEEYGLKYLEINLSPKQCLQEDLASVFLDIMHEYKIDPKYINLEITETAEVVENDTWLATIDKLSAAGVEFSIDDFGSGFSSADYLITVPVSIVKIDKSILWQAMNDKKAMIILVNTIRMIKDLGIKIVVEGVENTAMFELLKENHVDYLQGYFFSKPVSTEEFFEVLTAEGTHK